MPYIPLEKGSAYLESRYYYIAAGGGGILLAGFFELLRSLLMRFVKLQQRLAGVILFIPLLFFIYANIIYIQQDIETQVSIAKERKEFLAVLQNLHPAPKNDTVFYITGNTDYYISDHRVPFQQGMGYTLMVWYYKTGIVPKELLQQAYLWGMMDQGHREVEDKGFGYYWDINKLKEEIKNKKIKKENVIGLFYDSKSKSLKNYSVDSAI